MHEAYPVRYDFIPVGFSQTDEVHLISADGTKTQNSEEQNGGNPALMNQALASSFSSFPFRRKPEMVQLQFEHKIRTRYVILQIVQENTHVLSEKSKTMGRPKCDTRRRG